MKTRQYPYNADYDTDPEALERFQKIVECALGIPFSEGNQIKVLRNGEQIFPAMLDAIAASTSTIDLVTFVYWKGDIARRIAHALAERARAGVRVQIVLDAVGASAMPDELIEILRESGVEINWFRPPVRWKIWHADHRTHRKVLVCDGQVGFTGGVGIAEEWEGDARNPSEWRDSQFLVRGPAIYGLEAAFLGNWAEIGHSIHHIAEEVIDFKPEGQAKVQVVRATASIGWSDIATLMRVLISIARRRLSITTAYFVPDEASIDLLCQAARRGVEVSVLVPGRHTDYRFVQLASEDTYRPLLDAGVRIWAYQQTMLHAKIITIDGAVACIGSANFNQRSMRKDDEVCLVAIDPATVEVLDRHFVEDLQCSEAIVPGKWRRRNLVQRLKEEVAQLFRAEM